MESLDECVASIYKSLDALVKMCDALKAITEDLEERVKMLEKQQGD